MERRVDRVCDAVGRSIRGDSVRRVFTAEVRERGLQDTVHLLHRNVVFHASKDAHRSISAVAKRGRVLHRVRDPDVRGIARLNAAEA